jgi:hypothetical protein
MPGAARFRKPGHFKDVIAMKFNTLALLGSLAGFSTLGHAAESEGAKSDLDAVTFGEQIYGPKIDLESLKGRVVLVKFWGIK